MANPQSSETPAHQRLVALIEAVNSGDDERLSKFVADTFDGAGQRPEFATQQVADLKRLSRLSGGLELRRVERSTSAAIEALLQTRGSRAWYKLSLFVTAQPPEYSEAAAPYNIVGMDWRNIAAPLSLAEKQSDAEVRHRLDRLMNWLVERDGFSGVVQVERGGQTLYARAFGLANRERNQANGLDTRFNLASITKMFTAVAVGQLVEAGKLRFDSKVGELLPDFPNKSIADSVTVGELLSHTSGMIGGGEAIQKGLEPPRGALTIAEMMRPTSTLPLSFRPGQQYQYSNAGYILLGAIIEKVSGRSFHDYVRDNVFRKAGMTDTDFYRLDLKPPKISIGYKEAPGGTRNSNVADLGILGTPANMAFATARDMSRFADALRDGRLVGKPVLDQLWNGVTEERDGSEYGYGAHIDSYDGERIVWHGGGAPGVTNRFEIYPDRGTSVVVLTNYDGDPDIITNKLREWLSTAAPGTDHSEAQPKLDIGVAPSTLKATAGKDVRIDVLVTNSGGIAHSAVVDLEIKDSAGAKVDQQITGDQKLSGGKRLFSYIWKPKAPGRFTISAGVFSSGWSSKLIFVDDAAQIEVGSGQ